MFDTPEQRCSICICSTGTSPALHTLHILGGLGGPPHHLFHRPSHQMLNSVERMCGAAAFACCISWIADACVHTLDHMSLCPCMQNSNAKAGGGHLYLDVAKTVFQESGGGGYKWPSTAGTTLPDLRS